MLLSAPLSSCGAHHPADPGSGPSAASGPTEVVAIPRLGVTSEVPAGTEVVHTGAGATF